MQTRIQIKCIQTSETNKFTSNLSSGNSSYRQAVNGMNGYPVQNIMPMVTLCTVAKPVFTNCKYSI